MPAHCHYLIAKTAKEMAAALYEEQAKDDVFYSKFPSRRNYVRLVWPELVNAARSTLVDMLAAPHIHETMKQEILEALTLDKSLTKFPERVH